MDAKIEFGIYDQLKVLYKILVICQEYIEFSPE